MKMFGLCISLTFFLCLLNVNCSLLGGLGKSQDEPKGNGRDYSAFDKILILNKNTAEQRKTDKRSTNDHSAFARIFAINENAEKNGFKRSLKQKLIDGDIVMPPKSRPVGRLARQRRSTEYYGISLWPVVNGKREVPYLIDNEILPNDSVIESAINEWMQNVPCLNFVPRTTQEDYLHFYNDSGCFSSIGLSGKRQGISLGLGCRYHEIVLHEIGHALGFWHEQSRPDRDQYVKILWDNILQGMEPNFNIKQSYDYSLSSPYDPGSVMHYGPYAFSKDNIKATIESLSDAAVGQSLHLSDADVALANSLYDCGNCFDLDTGCKHWADQGDCTNGYRQWMLKYCQKTCCFPGDTHQSCSYWASIGECEKNPGWMLENCKGSCNTCTCS